VPLVPASSAARHDEQDGADHAEFEDNQAPRAKRRRQPSDLLQRVERLEEQVAWLAGETVAQQVRKCTRSIRLVEVPDLERHQVERHILASLKRAGLRPVAVEVLGGAFGRSAIVEFSSAFERVQAAELALQRQLDVAGRPLKLVKLIPSYRQDADVPIKLATNVFPDLGHQLKVWWPGRVVLSDGDPIARAHWTSNTACACVVDAKFLPELKNGLESR